VPRDGQLRETALLPDDRRHSSESSGELGVRQRIGFHVSKLGIDVSLLLGVRDGESREDGIERGEERGEVNGHLSCLGCKNIITRRVGGCMHASVSIGFIVLLWWWCRRVQ